MTDGDRQALPEMTEDVVYNRVSDGGVLLSTEGEIYFGLNETGALIWEHLEECDTIGELCAVLAREYPDVDRDELREDVEDLLDGLAGHGLVQGERQESGEDDAGGSAGPDVSAG